MNATRILPFGAAAPPPRSTPETRRGRRISKESDGAFTLIELLVAVAITAVIAGFIVTIVSNVSGFWSRNTGRMSADAQARYVLEQLTLDLQSALYRDDGATWLAASVLNNTSNAGNLWDVRGANTALLKPTTAVGTGLSYASAGGIATDTFGQAGTWLRFFTTKRGSNTSIDTASAPVAVGWQIVRRASSTNPASTDRRYYLHRAEVRPAPSTTEGPGTLDTGFDITLPAYAGTAAQAGNTGALGDPRSVRVPQDPGTIAGENVIDFGVRFYVRDATTGNLTSIFPAGGETIHFANRPPGIETPTVQFPEVADVMVRILTDEGSRRIADLEAGRIGTTPPNGVTVQGWWWQIAVANSQVFTRRIVLAPRNS